MSDHRLDDGLLLAVRAARPEVSVGVDSPFSPQAQALLERALSAECPGRVRRVRRTILRGRPRTLPAGEHRALSTGSSSLQPRRRRPTIGAAFAALLAIVGVAVGLLALTLLKHQPSVIPIPPSGAPPGGTASPPGSEAPNIAPRSFVIPSTAMLVAEAPDPRGGLPWGVREVRTSRGQACLVVGRVQGAMVGVIGQDGAWANDRRFHPIPLSGSGPFINQYCGDTDRNGNAFINVSDYAAIASAFGEAATNGSARGAAARVKLCPASSATGHLETTMPRRCPRADLRALEYGLLGPDAVSITYLGAGRRLYTEPTSGPDGAYLIVGTQIKAPCFPGAAGGRPQCGGVASVGPRLQPGVITAVTYRDGRVCHLPAPTPRGAVANGSCPLLGYQSPPFKHVTEAQVAAPVAARVLPAKHYCNSTGRNFPGCSQFVLDIAFTARVAVTNLNSYYEGVIDMPPRDYTPGGRTGCPGGGSTFGPTQINIRTGQRIRWRALQGSFPRDCTGNIINVTVAYVPNSYLGLNGIGSKPWPSPGRGSIVVGRARIILP